MNNVVVFCPTHEKKKILSKCYFSIWFLTEKERATLTSSVNIMSRQILDQNHSVQWWKKMFSSWFNSYKTKFSSNLVPHREKNLFSSQETKFCRNIILLKKKKKKKKIFSSRFHTWEKKHCCDYFFHFAHKEVSNYSVHEFLFPCGKKKSFLTLFSTDKKILFFTKKLLSSLFHTGNKDKFYIKIFSPT